VADLKEDANRGVLWTDKTGTWGTRRQGLTQEEKRKTEKTGREGKNDHCLRHLEHQRQKTEDRRQKTEREQKRNTERKAIREAYMRNKNEQGKTKTQKNKEKN
jgi:hypothetical protein